ncbi:diphosphomevalonate decarboxylase [Aureococcus anophagefferens]|nr:diphosphomevalonate decarboxylase [Aureococcus anophagefferens]
MALGTPAPLATFDVASASAPTNIAVVKYWGKDEARGGNTPINSSCSLTLDPADLRAETVMVASPELDRDELWLNGAPVDVAGASTHARRLRACRRARCGACAPPLAAATAAELAGWRVRVVSRNTFPTAAGLASSAAGYAALVRCAAALYGVAVDASLSGVARVGSGSACRSSTAGSSPGARAPRPTRPTRSRTRSTPRTTGPPPSSSSSRPPAKETPSTEGMRRSVATSPFLAHRAAAVAEPRVFCEDQDAADAFAALALALFGPRGGLDAFTNRPGELARARRRRAASRAAAAAKRGAR